MAPLNRISVGLGIWNAESSKLDSFFTNNSKGIFFFGSGNRITMDIQSRANIKSIVESFYKTAMQDDQIGYIFTDVAHLDLVKHLPRIVDFWESVLFGVGKYQGNPVLKHVHLHSLSPLTKAHFDRWLTIWNKTISDHYHGEKATEAISKAKMMGDLMLFKIAASENEGFVQ